jgi:transketolase
MGENTLEENCINTVRLLAVDAVQKANSGHPGMPMGAAPMGHVLWARCMRYNPRNPDWANRDRFILSAGHGCMLQYSFLYLTGYDLTLDDLKNFRQLGSKTAGHPEYGLLSGIDVTTGPLGQGFANGVGLAIAQKHLAARYNKPGFDLFDYSIYALCSDGDMMEGITSEAASLAGHLELGNIIYLYDDNHISIEGNTNIAFTENVAKRFDSYNWHVQIVDDGNDLSSIEKAISSGKEETRKPSLIIVRTQIGFGSPNKVNTPGIHGSPLGEEEIRIVKTSFGFDPEKSFFVPDEVAAYYSSIGEKGISLDNDWIQLFARYKEAYPELAIEYEQTSKGQLPHDWQKTLPIFEASTKKIATRQASGKVLNALAPFIQNLIGGAADLAPSTETYLHDYSSFSAEDRGGRNFHFGIREHAMGAILNGMSLTKGIISFGATFLIFSEYMRPPIRLAAIMKIRPIFVFTHDSIGLGEDGTTHQPIEQLISLRAIPNIVLIRPADANETSQAWRVALEHSGGPVVLIFTRQGLPVIDQEKNGKAAQLEKGAYVLSDPDREPEIILIASGSEIALVMYAQAKLSEEGIAARVVSMPSWELFEKQNDSYKEKILPKVLKKRLAVEAGSPIGWHKYVGEQGDILAMHRFGESGPADDLYDEFGFTIANVVAKAKTLLRK